MAAVVVVFVVLVVVVVVVDFFLGGRNFGLQFIGNRKTDPTNHPNHPFDENSQMIKGKCQKAPKDRDRQG